MEVRFSLLEGEGGFNIRTNKMKREDGKEKVMVDFWIRTFATKVCNSYENSVGDFFFI